VVKRVTVVVRWESRTELEVEDDWKCPSNFNEFTDDQVAAFDEDAARELTPVDWERWSR
jgi:hypothetical protein